MLFDLSYKLNSGEKLVGIARKHWFLIVPRLIEFLIIISLLIIFANKLGNSRESFAITVILIACFIAYFIYTWILTRVDYFIITSERIIRIKQKGVWDRDLNEISILDISNITLNEKGIAAAFLKFGSIKITLKNSALFNMANIADCAKIYQGLIKLKGIKKA
ncbi:hypothetical protein KKB43_02075 [Patescibacteria group bacterium]|nr:hypothetical protein [Patescibacteria group bacterium]MBU4141802.1 hypothetical protein [Patescibacteria group bacterium]MBU4338101.1 hypothetical protein [Patescibacteria group bacterium]MBU4579781.1 hypothetical protein [Patescibacteria group bacterium]